uniref:Solute carrier family 25 member 27 n=1 Tax=Sinocyclocheilus rhinocerous TaxID=307959 RepID=A0A673MA52_9TELE
RGGPENQSSLLQENSRWPRVSKFTLSACAATVAELVTFPLDLTKTRLQIQGEGGSRQHGGSVQPPKHRGMLSTALGIVREEWPLNLWQGVTPAIYRHIVYSGGRMLAYEQLRESVLGRSEDGIFPVWKAVIGSMIPGALGQFIASPTDLVKVQIIHGVYHAFTKIIAEGGIRGLWAGWVPSVQRAALVNLGDLLTYDTVKHSLLTNTSIPDNSICHGLARGLLYKSSTDCLAQSVRKEGFFYCRAPWSLTFWLTFEQMRRAMGISSF